MPFDYKKEYKEFYLPPKKPSIVTIPKMQFVAVRGKGDPNEVKGTYEKAMSALYSVAYTLKMSYKTQYKIKGFFEYVVPPLEGFWWQGNAPEQGMDYTRKADLSWISVLRLPDFVETADVDWARKQAEKKKKEDFSAVEFWVYEEGLCVQCMHTGPYDDEPATVDAMHVFAEENGYKLDFSPERLHHEIYLSDPRKTEPNKLKTVVRHPIVTA